MLKTDPSHACRKCITKQGFDSILSLSSRIPKKLPNPFPQKKRHAESFTTPRPNDSAGPTGQIRGVKRAPQGGQVIGCSLGDFSSTSSSLVICHSLDYFSSKRQTHICICLGDFGSMR